MTFHPDIMYSREAKSYTFLINIDNGKFNFSKFPVSHEDILGSLGEEELESYYPTYHETYRELPSRAWDRYVFQEYADGYLGRLSNKNSSYSIVSFWAHNEEDAFSDEKLLKIVKKLFKNTKRMFMEVHVPTETFSESTPMEYNQKIVYFKKTETNNIVVISKEEFEKNLQFNKVDKKNKKNDIKKYEILGNKYSLNDLATRRKDLHLKGAKAIDPVLCAIDEKKYPELRGYKPMNCPKETIPTYKINKLSVPRGKDDWHGQPIWKLTSENSFKSFLNKLEN
jgi:hypothetical protein